MARLKELGELAIHEELGRMPAERVESSLPDMALLIGQSGDNADEAEDEAARQSLAFSRFVIGGQPQRNAAGE